jgi:hypothetical protein
MRSGLALATAKYKEKLRMDHRREPRAMVPSVDRYHAACASRPARVPGGGGTQLCARRGAVGHSL